MPHLTTDEAARAAAQAEYRAARARMTRLLAFLTGAAITEPCSMWDGRIVQGGTPAELAKVAAHFAKLGVSSVTVDAPDADDPDWTFIRIPDAEIAAARARHNES